MVVCCVLLVVRWSLLDVRCAVCVVCCVMFADDCEVAAVYCSLRDVGCWLLFVV